MWFSVDPLVVEVCLSICDGCPVQVACLAGAMGRRERWGVWGGRLFLSRYGGNAEQLQRQFATFGSRAVAA